MSFSRLLAAGTSLVGMTNAQTPYRMREENLLPKFESKKNPFAAPKTEAHNAAPAKVEAVAATSAVKVAPMETYPLFDAQLKPAVACATVEPQAAAVSHAPEPELNHQATEASVSTQLAGASETFIAQRRLPRPEANVGLVDASPLGLKTGTPARAPLPEPVVAPAKAPVKPAPEKPATPEQPTKA